MLLNRETLPQRFRATTEIVINLLRVKGNAHQC